MVEYGGIFGRVVYMVVSVLELEVEILGVRG